MDQQNNILDTILTKVVNIEDSIESIQSKMFTKDEAREMKDEIFTHIDGFVKLHQILDMELVALRSKYERLEERLTYVENKVGIAV